MGADGTMSQGYTVAVVGATGAVGETLLQILEERKFPVRTIRLFASERSAGRQLRFLEEEVPVEPLAADAFRGIHFVLFSAGASRSREFAPAAARAGAVVIDNSSAFRMDPEVPLVVPEINPEAAFRHQIHPDTGKPHKKLYDPRKWLRIGELGIVRRLDEAFADLGSAGKSLAG